MKMSPSRYSLLLEAPQKVLLEKLNDTVWIVEHLKNQDLLQVMQRVWLCCEILFCLIQRRFLNLSFYSYNLRPNDI